ncbi:MAG: sulfate adenylyltransferase subunit CysN [Prolixibacteraceae bacterium]|nr:sulfate adenylyltransferase subunit CysN [Prolixibacteraceae bacterium]
MENNITPKTVKRSTCTAPTDDTVVQQSTALTKASLSKERSSNNSVAVQPGEASSLLRILTAGSVDDGKSTLIGRLIFDSKSIYEDHLSALIKDSKRTGHAGDNIDYALLLDGLRAEREQGITIDVAYRYFSTEKRKFIIADCPGHEQYTRNMATGASTANLAIILVDATKGLLTQTRRHTFIVSLLGIKHVVLAVNKMDLVNYDNNIFNKICSEYKSLISRINITEVECIPLSALKGDNIIEVSENMKWYHGKSLLEFLENVHVTSDRNYDDLRFPVQYVNRPGNNFRGFAGRIASGVISKGDTITVIPSMKTSVVKSIVTYDGEPDSAGPAESVTITTEDEIDISRGEMIVHPDNLPHIERHFEANLVWMDEKAMEKGVQYYIKNNTNITRARIASVIYNIDINTLKKTESDNFNLNDIGKVAITSVKPLFFDTYSKNRITGSFILIDPITHNTCAAGMITDISATRLSAVIADSEIHRKVENGQCLISDKERRERYNQKGETIWITGLHGSGKNVMAYLLEKELFDLGANVVLLDGSTVRSGLSRELDHSPADRAEHLRRVAHICRILNDQGIITICSFISPDENMRNQVADLIGKERFHLVYLDADTDYCMKNSPDLYEMFDKGLIDNLPGKDAIYEAPVNPSLICTPGNEENIERIIEYLRMKGVFPLRG